MENKVCKILKKEEVIWDNELNKFLGEMLNPAILQQEEQDEEMQQM